METHFGHSQPHLRLAPQVLVGLYEEPERPAHPLDYIRRYLGAPTAVDVDGLKRENEELKRQLDKLKKQLPTESS